MDIISTFSFQFRQLFHQNYKALNGTIDVNQQKQQIRTALTLHPYKNHLYLYDTAQYLLIDKIKQLKEKMFNLTRDIEFMDNMINKQNERFIEEFQLLPDVQEKLLNNMDVKFMGSATGMKYEMSPEKSLLSKIIGDFGASSRDLVPEWSSFDKYNFYSHTIVNKKASSVPPFNTVEKNHIRLLFHKLTAGVRTKRKFSIKSEYQVLNPKTFVVTIANVRECCFHRRSHKKQYIVKQSLSKLEAIEKGTLFPGIGESRSNRLINNEQVNFIILLSGRSTTFHKFMDNFETEFLRHKENVSMLVILYNEERKQRTSELMYNTIQKVNRDYPEKTIRLIQRNGPFHRGVALQEASKYFQSSDLLIFIDVDCVISREILVRIRFNTIRGNQVYFPIMFSDYNPEYMQ